MLYFLGQYLQSFFGPARLLQSYTVLIAIALYLGFFLSYKLIPKFYNKLPHDRGREFAIKETSDAAKGKPTGTGVVFITIFVVLCFLLIPFSFTRSLILLLTWFTMLSGFLDDRSVTSWGEYLKGFLDLLISVAASVVLYHGLKNSSVDGVVSFWLPFVSHTVAVNPVVYVVISTIMLWASINTTNCTDGVDGLSATLVLIALITLGIIFYFILGHVNIASYLLVPHIAGGANWAVMIFALAGVLMGYLWHNAFPSKCLMGDAGSRALGFFIGVCVMVSGNPFLILATSSIIFVNGGMGLLKVFLLRFFKIKIFETIRFPLHDHMRKNRGWSPTQVLIKFMIMQLLITCVLVGILFKIR
ncbi:MAG: phospho-N-acetylmuramoyl-pentapeptide-transferase [Treponema bryantii]|nr:phospho-N-acetylmuramoyl-pentapeptide-transferase [Treponema bryantii]